MSDSEIIPTERRPPPSWMVAPSQQPPLPVLHELPPAAPAVVALPLSPVPPIKAGPVPRARTSGVEEDLRQARPWNLPAWK